MAKRISSENQKLIGNSAGPAKITAELYQCSVSTVYNYRRMKKSTALSSVIPDISVGGATNTKEALFEDLAHIFSHYLENRRMSQRDVFDVAAQFVDMLADPHNMVSDLELDELLEAVNLGKI